MRAGQFLNLSLLLIILIIIVYFIIQYDESKIVWHSSETEAVVSLIQIYNAEWKWYNSDIDGNSLQDFWTRDIAGLFFYDHHRNGKKVKLIPREIAIADAKPYPSFYIGNTFESTPYKGYSFKMAIYDELGFFQAKKDPATGLSYLDDKFCIIAFPTLNRNLHTFIINSNKRIMYCKLNTIKEVDKWPNDLEIKDWKELEFKK